MIITLKGKKPKIGKNVYIAESAQVIGEVSIGNYSSIWPNAVLRADIEPIKIGKCSSIQDGVLIHVNWDLPVIVGDYVTVGHGAHYPGWSRNKEELSHWCGKFSSGRKKNTGRKSGLGSSGKGNKKTQLKRDQEIKRCCLRISRFCQKVQGDF